MLRRSISSAACALLLCAASLFAQAPRIDKVDPPNWWINMPAPMLLVKGEHFSGARFTAGKLPIERTVISQNGHWAELWLGKGDATTGTITVRVESQLGHAEVPFEFAARRAPSDGLSGFSSRDVMYLIMIDRFADGDHGNDGPNAKDFSTAQLRAQSEPIRAVGTAATCADFLIISTTCKLWASTLSGLHRSIKITPLKPITVITRPICIPSMSTSARSTILKPSAKRFTRAA